MQMISENVPIWASQKLNKLASFDSMEIAMEGKTGHVFTQRVESLFNLLVPVG